MTVVQKKVCMLGSFAVGKTSLVRRFVSNVYDDKYLTTVGVRIEKRDLHIDDYDVRLLLWDLHGEDRFQFVRPSHLRGAAGYVLVVDGTRPDTVAVAETLRDRARETLADVPYVVVLNKADLELSVDPDEVQSRLGQTVHITSAKTGDGVKVVFESIARLTL
ncbi:MAG: Rab family GTPase [Myxococcota bacterium]